MSTAAIKERPILFSDAMVRALLAGTKSQTRRVCKPAENLALSAVVEVPDPLERGQVYNGSHFGDEEGEVQFPSPYGGRCDRLWVRETWQHSNHPYGPYDEDCMVFYRADFLDDVHGPDGEKSPEGRYRFWRPSIHMPRAASRITLEITGVRVERLQDISEADAQAEGTTPIPDPCDHVRLACADIGCSGPQPYRAGFRSLWQDINGLGSWEANPWVWVLEFRCLSEGGAA